MKKILTILIMILLFPLTVSAEEINIYCNDVTLENNKETECQIKASNLSFNATSVSGEVTVSDNLKIISSNYDNNNWKILDKTFDVRSINLMSENKNNGSSFVIATFKVKATNKTDTTGKINFINVELGDENYNEHTLNAKETTIDLIYDNKNEEINKNPNTSDIKIIIPIILIVAVLGYLSFNYKKRTKKEQ